MELKCGGCGGTNLTLTSEDMNLDTLYGVCADCLRCQEVETRPDPQTQLCDNCAFRKGSPERNDPYRWAEIQEVVATGQVFHCHKGLNFTPQTGQFAPPDPAKGSVTVCAGYLAALAAHKLKEKVDG